MNPGWSSGSGFGGFMMLQRRCGGGCGGVAEGLVLWRWFWWCGSV
ncbi:hypothetical protein Hdeb2414_s0010g00347231 [Helianthus debilis subsp. tardiflorus]